MLALEGIKILDLTQAAPGAYSTMILGDLGAEVLKIEPPPTAKVGLPGTRFSAASEEDRRSAAYYAINRNKKGMGLNLKAEEGRQIFFKLAEWADVIFENFRPGVTKRLGVDYERVKEVNPRIIYCSLTGYGQDGPYRDIPGHDINYISTGGALGMIGKPDDLPVVPQNLIGDFAGGSLFATVGILTALLARERNGIGQYVDVSMTDGVTSLLTWAAGRSFASGKVPQRGTLVLDGAYPYYGIYETKDKKYISIGCLEPWFWENLCKALGREDLIPFKFEAEHRSEKPKGEKWTEISKFLKQAFLTKTRDEWFDSLSKADVPIAKVYALDEIFNDPQVVHRQMVVEPEHPTFGKVKQVGIPIKLSETPGKVRKFSPLIGEDTEEELLKLGYTPEQIKALRESGVVI